LNVNICGAAPVLRKGGRGDYSPDTPEMEDLDLSAVPPSVAVAPVYEGRRGHRFTRLFYRDRRKGPSPETGPLRFDRTRRASEAKPVGQCVRLQDLDRERETRPG
jgi:hypothetical protein